METQVVLWKQTQYCAVQGVLYEITCNTCTEPVEAGDNNKETRQPGGQARCNYIGMTRTSVHYRMMGHLQGQKARSRKNPLWRHDLGKHQGHPQQYTTRVLQKERNLLPLCISEGLYIERQMRGTNLNDKNEYGRGSLIRIVASRDNT